MLLTAMLAGILDAAKLYAAAAIEELPHVHVEGGGSGDEFEVLVFIGLLIGTIAANCWGVYFLVGKCWADVKQDTKFFISLAVTTLVVFVAWTPLLSALRWLTPWAALGAALFFVLAILGGIASLLFRR
jgi:drug/metabolite transporter (DMT)-like permease